VVQGTAVTVDASGFAIRVSGGTVILTDSDLTGAQGGIQAIATVPSDAVSEAMITGGTINSGTGNVIEVGTGP
jgi:hypothetical protein